VGVDERRTVGADARPNSKGARSNMMKREKFQIANIYVPVKRRSTLKPEVVEQIAQSMLENGQETPILVRRDGDRFVLVHGLHRLEACKALGEETILGYLVQAQKH
jgi:sulfiredoxin